MRRRFQLWWELGGNRWVFGFGILACAAVVAFWVSGVVVGETLGFRRYGASVPVLQTHHLEVRACRLSEPGSDVRVRLYFTNLSMLSIDNLRFEASLDGQLPLQKPEAIKTLRHGTIHRGGVFPVDTRQVEVRFPPASEGRLRISVEYTVRTLPPTTHTAMGEVFLKPCWR